MSELARGLHQLTALEDLNLNGNTVDPAAGAALGRGVSKMIGLKTLWLMCCHIDDVTAVSIAEGAADLPRLQTLLLNSNQISPRGEERVKEIIGGRVRRVELYYQEPPFYRRPLSHDTVSEDNNWWCLHDTSDSDDDDDNSYSDENSVSDDNAHLSPSSSDDTSDNH
ncbi:hypothetical protein LSAT2_013313 [Lamellibrachia satsuma]|nr:hypothetical protein LSAT2_013313 [Lamellibrachia satsuma]